LFNAMIERVVMPLEAALAQLDTAEPLQDLRAYMLAGLRMTVEDPRARRVFAIAALKMEFVGELEAARVRRRRSLEAWMERAEERVGRAAESGELRPGVVPRAAALAMWSLVDGLIRNWLFEPDAFDLLEVGAQAIDAQLNGLRA
jgi:TetR/AcrR family acrAB operon transcriptional repressor